MNPTHEPKRLSLTQPDPASQLRVAAMRVLLKLAEPGATLAFTHADSGSGAGVWEIKRAGGQAKSAQVAAEVAQGLISDDLVEADERRGQFVISSAGKAALRRALARSEPFREQNEQRAFKPLPGEPGVHAMVNEAESPLGWLRSRTGKDGRPLIDDTQFRAGERLRSDFTRAQMEPRVTAKWDAVASSRRERRGAGQAHAITDTALAARQRIDHAMAAVGPDFASILLDVCCFLKGLEDAEKRNGWPQRSGKIVLGLALNALARHYGFVATGRDARGRGAVHHWGAEDYRPALGGAETSPQP
jgi:hypothetical protein